MLSAADVANAFERNRRLVHRHSEGLSHEDSLIQPPFRGNCLNWLIGHIVVHRDKVLHNLGVGPVLGAGTTARYDNESNPITGPGKHVSDLPELLGHLDESQRRLVEALTEVTDDDLTAEIRVLDRTTTLAKRIHFLYFHETYHAGQTELLRELALAARPPDHPRS